MSYVVSGWSGEGLSCTSGAAESPSSFVFVVAVESSIGEELTSVDASSFSSSFFSSSTVVVVVVVVVIFGVGVTTAAHGPHGWPATTCVTGFTSTSDEEDEVGEGDDPEASSIGFGFGFVPGHTQ